MLRPVGVELASAELALASMDTPFIALIENLFFGNSPRHVMALLSSALDCGENAELWGVGRAVVGRSSKHCDKDNVRIIT